MRVFTVQTVFIHTVQKNKLKKHESVCNDHDCCHVEIPNKDNKILKYNQGENLLKASFSDLC